MSHAVDADLRERVRTSSVETREAIFEDLLDEAIALNTDPEGALIRSALLTVKDLSARLRAGLPSPADGAQALQNLDRIRELLKLTPEDETELARRQADEANWIDADEFIRRLQAGRPVGSR
jgi:hypothetical protein